MTRKAFHIAALALLGTVFFSVGVSASELTEDTAQGWTPAIANRWMEAQLAYSMAVRQYGANSPEATQAQVSMNTLARDLGIKASQEVPQTAPTPKEPESLPLLDLETSTDTK